MDLPVVENYIFLTDIFNLPTLTIYDGLYPCKKTHNPYSINVVVFCNKTTNLIKIRVQYCPICKEYYIRKEIFSSYQSFYKGLLVKIQYFDNCRDDFDDNNFNKNTYCMKTYSKLMLYGYHVSGDNLSETDRQNLLMYLIYYDLVSKGEVEKQLKEHIARRGRRNPKAKVKWERDLLFVENYDTNIESSRFEYLKEHYNDFRYGITFLKRKFLKEEKYKQIKEQ